MDTHGVSRTILDFLTDTSRTLADIHEWFLISSQMLHERSRSFTNNFWFSHGHLTDAHRLSQFLIFSRIPYEHSWTFTNSFYFHTDTSRMLTDVHEWFLILWQKSHEGSRNSTNNFWFTYVQLMDAHGLSRTIFNFLMDTSRTLPDFNGQFLIFHRCLTDACLNSCKIFDFSTDA